ncbi:MAG: TonB-dependent receptor [Paucibacter sp.]|nr:TonB-dependent receptor [Roseateles sp.]
MIPAILLAVSNAALPPVLVQGRAEGLAATVITAEPLLQERPVADWLAGAPGVFAAERGNYAQDTQLSIRGFGARSSFGVRGLRVYVDGIPATMPDGSGSLSHVPLASLESIELLRGPFSALYGSNSGGVLVFSTRSANGHEPLRLSVQTGSFGERLLRVQSGHRLGDAGLRVDASTWQQTGWRPQAAAERQLLDLRLDQQGLRLSFNALRQSGDDPQGLSRAQWDAKPFSTAPPALAFNTRKTTDQWQLGAGWSGGNAWAGQRQVRQWQSIPAAVQAPASHPGGVIELARNFAGLDLRTHRMLGTATAVLGLAVEGQWDERKGFENFIGSQLGLTGALRRAERNRALGLDLYAQLRQPLSAATSLQAGLRGSRLQMRSQDHFTGNGDDSGSRSFATLSPMLGISHRVGSGWSLYASAGSAHETPTLNELAYRSDGSSGFNTSLQAQQSRQIEIGVRGNGLELSAFSARSRDEIIALGSVGGRARFGNAEGIRRSGAELSWQQSINAAWDLQLALTALHARLSDGTVLPGAPAQQAFAALGWQVDGWRAQARLQAQSKLWADARNAAPGFGLLHLALQREGHNPAGPWQLRLALDNLFDKRHAASVIVAEANGRFLEPGAPRRWQLGFSQSFL